MASRRPNSRHGRSRAHLKEEIEPRRLIQAQRLSPEARAVQVVAKLGVIHVRAHAKLYGQAHERPGLLRLPSTSSTTATARRSATSPPSLQTTPTSARQSPPPTVVLLLQLTARARQVLRPRRPSLTPSGGSSAPRSSATTASSSRSSSPVALRWSSGAKSANFGFLAKSHAERPASPGPGASQSGRRLRPLRHGAISSIYRRQQKGAALHSRQQPQLGPDG